MKVAPVLAAALVIYIAIPGSNQGKGKRDEVAFRHMGKKHKPKFCTGADGNRYKKGESYEDKEACIRYTCTKSRNKFKMKMEEIQCVVDLTLNVTSLEASVMTLLDTVGSLTTKVEDITKKVDANTAKGDANAAAIALKCDKSTCTTIQAAQTKLETCLGDVTSSDCPAVANGKTGVATVSANAAALANKCDATKCTAVQTKVTDVESCLSDTTSAKCPAAASGKKSVPGAIAELETPTVFSCYYSTPAITADTALLAPYAACDVNVGTAMNKTTGVFTAKKAGKYRFTFMTLVLPENKKKTIVYLMQQVGNAISYVARALAQSKIGIEQEQVTITLDVILDVAVGTEIYISLTMTAPASIPQTPAAPWQTWFTGEYISA